MNGRFVKNDEIARFARDIIDDFLIDFPLSDFLWATEVCLVTSGNDTESAVSFVNVVELVLKNDHSTTHLPVSINVVL